MVTLSSMVVENDQTIPGDRPEGRVQEQEKVGLE